MKVSAPIKFFGSKGTLAERIVSMLPPHRVYVEAFGGSAAVLLAKEPAPEMDVYNDLNDNLATLFSVLRDDALSERLQELLELTLYSREEYDRCIKAVKRGKFDDKVEQARATFVAYNLCVNGMITRAAFSTGPSSGQRLKGFRQRIKNLPLITERLSRAVIERKHFRDLIPLYDTSDTCFYLDPPYDPDTREPDSYEVEMYPHEHKELVMLLLGLKGTAILSGYDTPLYRPLDNAGWERTEIEMTVGGLERGDSHSKRTEVLWVSPATRKASRDAPQQDLQKGERMQLSLM